MPSAIGETFSGDRTKVLDVVGDDCPSLAIRAVEHLMIRLLNQIGTLHHCLCVQSAIAQQTCYCRREMLIQQHLHEASARWPASQAA